MAPFVQDAGTFLLWPSLCFPEFLIFWGSHSPEETGISSFQDIERSPHVHSLNGYILNIFVLCHSSLFPSAWNISSQHTWVVIPSLNLSSKHTDTSLQETCMWGCVWHWSHSAKGKQEVLGRKEWQLQMHWPWPSDRVYLLVTSEPTAYLKWMCVIFYIIP